MCNSWRYCWAQAAAMAESDTLVDKEAYERALEVWPHKRLLCVRRARVRACARVCARVSQCVRPSIHALLSDFQQRRLLGTNAASSAAATTAPGMTLLLA